MQSAQAGIAELRSRHGGVTEAGVRFRRDVMHAAQGEDWNASLLEGGQPRSDKAAVLLVGVRRVEQITGLQKQVNSLADSEIHRLPKSVSLALALFIALAGWLTGNGMPQVIIGSQYNCNDVVRFFLHRLYSVSDYTDVKGGRDTREDAMNRATPRAFRKFRKSRLSIVYISSGDESLS